VGGAIGGYESTMKLSLDEFEVQAAYYNIACAYAQTNQIPEAVAALQTAFDAGFDNYATVRSDPDLTPLQNSPDFIQMMDQLDPRKGFNPFGFFGGLDKKK
jgi:hypothetical protein